VRPGQLKPEQLKSEQLKPAQPRHHSALARKVRSLATAALVALAVALVAPCAAAADATASTPLDKYFDGLNTLRATFTQTVKDAKGKEVDRTTGNLVVSRPGKFRWEVNPNAKGAGGSQLLVADGKNVWFFDKDLEQVTVKPADAALSSTPAMLLSGATNIRDSFTLTPAGARDGLDWVLVEPRRPEADFRRALFGFGASGEKPSGEKNLQRMIIDDRLGQTATIDFGSVSRNARVAPEEVSFTPPPGADLIGTPVK
jgi:outer membrane lipoprotein carrier protein